MSGSRIQTQSIQKQNQNRKLNKARDFTLNIFANLSIYCPAFISKNDKANITQNSVQDNSWN